MSRVLFLRDEVETELEEARGWYEKRASGLGQEFLDAVQQQFKKIVDFPESYSRCHPEVHCVTMNRFPYVVYYRIEADWIEILALLHGKKISSIWRHRISRN
jgi:plasmid stabilization system protein ParE